MDGTLSEFLNLLDLRGQTWCFTDLRSSSAFGVARNEDVLFYAVIHGATRITGVAGATVELQPGNVAMVLSGEAHAVRTGLDGPAPTLEFLAQEQNVDVPPVITTTGNGVVTARVLAARLKVNWPMGLRRVSMPPIVTFGTDRRNFGSFSSLRIEMLQLNASGSGAAAMLTRLAALMLTSCLRNHPQCQLLFRSSAWNDPIAHALHLIGADPSSDWSVAQLARKVGMGRSSFAARFTEQVGRTPMDVITERRMQFAAELLQQSELKLIEISERAGYRSEAAFSRRFTRHFGLSPGGMRRNARLSRRAGSDVSALQAFITPAQHQPD